MKILLISDTHGHLDKVYRVLEKVKDIDLILHCGDYQKDAHELEDTQSIPVISVKGNCDGGHAPDRKIVETPYGKIIMTHGHLEGIDFDPTRLIYLAEENDCIAVCCGHTHVPVFEDFGGIYMINPGSISRPRDGSPEGSYAIIHSTEDDFYGNIVYYDKVFPSDSGNDSGKDSGKDSGGNGGSGGPGNKASGGTAKKKVQGGFLRGLLNYSDRF